MIKADSRALTDLNLEITRKLDEFLLTMNRLFAVQSRIQANWNDEQFGSFSDAMRKIIGAKTDVESGVIEIRSLISEMIQLADQYNKIRF